MLPPGLVPPYTITFSRPTSPESATFPCGGPKLGSLQGTKQLYSDSLVHMPQPLQTLPPASLSPKVGTNNFRPETAGDTSQ